MQSLGKAKFESTKLNSTEVNITMAKKTAAATATATIVETPTKVEKISAGKTVLQRSIAASGPWTGKEVVTVTRVFDRAWEGENYALAGDELIGTQLQVNGALNRMLRATSQPERYPVVGDVFPIAYLQNKVGELKSSIKTSGHDMVQHMDSIAEKQRIERAVGKFLKGLKVELDNIEF